MAFDATQPGAPINPDARLLFLELNEVNVEQLLHYARGGHLPNFQRFFDRHGYETTTSEAEYDLLEPWIQWVTAHTGLTYAEHGVFRLGDITATDIPQIWEQLEARGLSVGAVSPMNAKYRLKNPAFFIPDPWTRTDIVAPGVLKRLYEAIAEAVNENASTRFSVKAAFNLALGGMIYARPQNYARYARLVTQARSRPWSRALFLDLLLSDVFVRCVNQRRPHFATLFLNAAAHIQHHYMYSSSAYGGELTNPDWYVADGVDPLLDVYKLYDDVLGQVQMAFPDTRLMLATGLHQDPHHALTFYWRLRDHDAFLRRAGVRFERVEPRMSRDFLVVCKDADAAAAAERLLATARTSDGAPLFDIDNRGSDLFVMLTWPDDVADDLNFTIGDAPMGPLKPQIAFVAIKNGRHNGVGYFADSGMDKPVPGGAFPLKQIPDRIRAAFAATV